MTPPSFDSPCLLVWQERLAHFDAARGHRTAAKVGAEVQDPESLLIQALDQDKDSKNAEKNENSQSRYYPTGIVTPRELNRGFWSH